MLNSVKTSNQANYFLIVWRYISRPNEIRQCHFSLQERIKLDHYDYRPISLISNIGKLIQKIVHKILYSFLEKNYLLFEQQYGFRNKLSTYHALIYITNRIQEACDNGQNVWGIYLEFQKTFDTVNHDMLMDKLAHYGFKGIENNWFKTYSN